MKTTRDLKAEYIPIDTLVPDVSNPRRISDEALETLTRSIAEFEDVQPVIYRLQDRMVIAGHRGFWHCGGSGGRRRSQLASTSPWRGPACSGWP